MISNIINSIGVRRLARECGVDPAAVMKWKRRGLPSRAGTAKDRARYERAMARLTGMKVRELRERIAEEEKATA